MTDRKYYDETLPAWPVTCLSLSPFLSRAGRSTWKRLTFPFPFVHHQSHDLIYPSFALSGRLTAGMAMSRMVGETDNK